MERQAGFLKALPAPSPAVWPWRATCVGWSAYGWRRVCSQLAGALRLSLRWAQLRPLQHSKWPCPAPASVVTLSQGLALFPSLPNPLWLSPGYGTPQK
jgi:hypothetical protein